MKNDDVRNEFSLKLSNRFALLAELENVPNMEERWENIKNTLNETAREVLGPRRARQVEQRFSQETWNLIGERKALKQLVDANVNNDDEELIESTRRDYKMKNREVQASIKRDENVRVNDLGTDAENAAARGNMRRMYEVTKILGNALKTTQKAPAVLKKNGTLTNTQEEADDRWAEHFEEILNRPDPSELDQSLAGAAAAAPILDISIEPPSAEEVARAVNKMKNNKSPGADNITAEMLKNGGGALIEQLTTLFGQMFAARKQPADFKKGIIVKLPKREI